MYKILGLPQFKSNENPCALCKCTGKGVNTWTDMRETAPWTRCIWTNVSWLAWEGRCRNALFTLPGVTALAVCLDYMHCKYLGMDQYQFGSCLWLLVNVIMEQSRGPLHNLYRVHDHIQQFYKQHRTPVRFRYMNKLSMFTKKANFPKLRGKAGEVKYFGKALLSAWEKYAHVGILWQRKVQVMLKANICMEDILTQHREAYALPPLAAKQFEKAAFANCQLQSQLAEHFLNEGGQKLFDVTSKAHMVLHAAKFSKHISPRRVWCFLGEDFMHTIQQLAQNCCKGRQAPDVINKMVQHYKLGMHFQFTAPGIVQD